ncbi:hypothetical protein GCM10010191_77130 [Actinomadura vinacea]|uniref:Uncharacterized protein n=1 Tax=Actinomadura vinacea TaxID=115336 RepID=A0ABP5XBK0_9ACTN
MFAMIHAEKAGFSEDVSDGHDESGRAGTPVHELGQNTTRQVKIGRNDSASSKDAKPDR